MFGLLSGPNDPLKMKNQLAYQMEAGRNAFFSGGGKREKNVSLADRLKELGVDDDRVMEAAKMYEGGGRLSSTIRTQQVEIVKKAAVEKMRAYQSRMKEIESHARQAAASGDVKKAAGLAREAAKMARGLTGTAKELGEETSGKAGAADMADTAASDPSTLSPEQMQARLQAQAQGQGAPGQGLPAGYTAQGAPVPAAAQGSEAGSAFLKAFVEETRGFVGRARKLVEEAERLRRLNDPDDRRSRKELQAAREDITAAEAALRSMGPVAEGAVGASASLQGGGEVEITYTSVSVETVTIAIEVTESFVDITV